MGKGDYLGEFEQIVLLALLRLADDETYGMRVRQEIEQVGGRVVSVPTVYAALERLERKGHVSSAVGDATPERGGRAKRYFRVEPAGREALRTAREMLVRMGHGIVLDSEAGR